ncbi:putative amino acid/polyamine transporter I, cationic amino acid transporter [Helianthus annuus]|uniref:Amino acid/polyamine transporter I, cationic amino acid transporter n=1 Tax=Helianthus annuus TaxID=4232 RepID=A0A251TBD5_HELAN|nr:cationic amino acid transporter 6, chloroplastic [Helianthus annuus]KAF5770532.1 putative amino acid/polyamine transporter I, cationic amino acid transporter [Helianthus annuus]KAJ0465416.1 putative amino acid/polyamine transporter I, cationic amino acid transporter [Helianthus annuus]KAJ0470239.1 putative amino acid/polyamine transporter I, cationic amino acid transporter [Helianthus annuus]KAJ0487017.1 putative amino acid/polyamine transporter I, cationic amino acid transporter [Helianthus
MRMAIESNRSSFSSVKSYVNALRDTPRRVVRRAGSVTTTFDETSHVRFRYGGSMRKTLRWYDLICFGVGGMVGAGVFVTTGTASHDKAGPAVVLSYAIAGFCALLSAFCYTEFAVHMPVAGGAFSYIRVTFGEFMAFLTGANLIMDYVFSNAAVARSFTTYLGTAIGVSAESKWRITITSLPKGFNEIDFIAVLVIIILTVIICYSTRESSVLNMILTALHIIFIMFVIIMGFWRGDSKNFTEPSDPTRPSGFFPFGASGMFNGAALVYLSYIGYDAVSTLAEEVKNPVTDIPIGVTGCVILVTVLYCLMATSMSMLLPYDLINPEAPFSGAFVDKSNRLNWVSNVIGVGASFGILTSLLVAMLGQARYLCVIGRSNIVPVWFAKVHPKTSTPVNASAFLGIFTAVIALFTELDVLLNLVSIGTLFVFFMVANAVIYRRYVSVETLSPWPTLSFLICFSCTSVIFTLLWWLVPPGKPKFFVLGACFIVICGLVVVFNYAVPQARKPEFWGVPLMPWIPCVSIFLNIFLLGNLDGPSYARFGFFSALAVVVYLAYSVHASFDSEEEGIVNLESGIKESIELEDLTPKLQK